MEPLSAIITLTLVVVQQYEQHRVGRIFRPNVRQVFTEKLGQSSPPAERSAERGWCRNRRSVRTL